jgi:zinc D-Ala-D-Ala carboxypeptidase
MDHNAPPPAARRTPRLLLGGLAVVLAVAAAAVLAPFGATSGSSSVPSPDRSSASWTGLTPAPSFGAGRGGDDPGVIGAADGVVTGRVSVFDDDLPAVANLDPSLLEALRRAASDADDDDVELQVNSGWRSPAYQEQLLQEAVSKYGSREEAAKWVSTPETSAHVTGEAVDIGPIDASAWLSQHGAAYGLCQIYGNEVWHYELRPEAVDDGCPLMYDDPTEDPRMRSGSGA